jgi:hypothetical protein
MLDSSAVEMARDFGAPLADAGELAWVWTDDGSFFVLQKSQATADAMWNDVKARTKLGGHQARPHAVLNMLSGPAFGAHSDPILISRVLGWDAHC